MSVFPLSAYAKAPKARQPRTSLFEWIQRLRAGVLLIFPTVLGIPGIGVRECASLNTALDFAAQATDFVSQAGDLIGWHVA